MGKRGRGMTCKDCIHFEACVDFWYSDYDGCTKEESVIKHANSPTCELFKHTADVVEVVRCKDCKYLTEEMIGEDLECICKRFAGMVNPAPDRYCSYGERREENERNFI